MWSPWCYAANMDMMVTISYSRCESLHILEITSCRTLSVWHSSIWHSPSSMMSSLLLCYVTTYRICIVCTHLFLFLYLKDFKTQTHYFWSENINLKPMQCDCGKWKMSETRPTHLPEQLVGVWDGRSLDPMQCDLILIQYYSLPRVSSNRIGQKNRKIGHCKSKK